MEHANVFGQFLHDMDNEEGTTTSRRSTDLAWYCVSTSANLGLVHTYDVIPNICRILAIKSRDMETDSIGAAIFVRTQYVDEFLR